jgi:hypothetical protein
MNSYDTWNQRSKVPFVVASIFAVALVAAASVYLVRDTVRGWVSPEAPEPRAAEAVTPEQRTRDTVLLYIAQPRFSGRDLERQVFGDARLELLELREKSVYFSFPKATLASGGLDERVRRFTNDPTRVERAKEDGGRLVLGDYSLAESDEKACLLRTPVDNVRVDPNLVVKVPFQRGTYTLTAGELCDFIDNRSVFGGLLNADTGAERDGRPLVMANHGAFVAKPGETSLDRFVDGLLTDIPLDGDRAREKRVQRLLDFVSSEIRYDSAEASYDVETLKRPNEVLMSRSSDCSNKTILLASLLEQIGEDYLLVYMPRHITVAVKQGQFKDTNRLDFEWQGERWLVAESTAPGFRIGLDRLARQADFKDILYVQQPRRTSVITRFSTGDDLEFR